MDDDRLKMRVSGEGAKRKHHFLRRYCKMFATSMRSQWQLTYIDLMAGPGLCRIRESDEIVPGSPLIALDYPFHEFVFCESEPDSVSALRTRVSAHTKRDLCRLHPVPWQRAVTLPDFGFRDGLTLAFVDPTGISQVPWSSMEVLIQKCSRLDILMTVQHGMGISLNKRQHLAKERDNVLDAFLGTDEWREPVQSGADLLKTSFALYCTKMKQHGFETRKWIPVANSSGSDLYYLCLFSRHDRGLDFWDKVLLKDEKGQTALPW